MHLKVGRDQISLTRRLLQGSEEKLNTKMYFLRVAVTFDFENFSRPRQSFTKRFQSSAPI